MRELFRTVTVVAVTVPVGAVGGTVSAGAEAVGADAAERSAGVGWAADGVPGCGAAALGAAAGRGAATVAPTPRNISPAATTAMAPQSANRTPIMGPRRFARGAPGAECCSSASCWHFVGPWPWSPHD